MSLKDLFTEMSNLMDVTKELREELSRQVDAAFKWDEMNAMASAVREIGDELKPIVESYYKGKMHENTVRLIVSVCNASMREVVSALELYIQAMKLCEKGKEHLVNGRVLMQRTRQYAFETFR